MPPRLKLRSLTQFTELGGQYSAYVCARCRYTTAATATTITPDNPNITGATASPSPPPPLAQAPTLTRYSTVQPPSYRDPKYRKSQLLRSYVSLLQTTPLIILFQHNNLRAIEWASIRRELANALQKVDDSLQQQSDDVSRLIADQIKLQVVQTNMLEPALRITEYFKPAIAPTPGQSASTVQQEQNPNAVAVSNDPESFADEKLDPALTHALSTRAYRISQRHKNQHPLSPMLVGNIALLTFPHVSPQHLRAALTILSPQAPTFPAPTRRTTPSYHDPAVQDGLKKLMLLGARVDGQIFDTAGTRWMGGIDGGIDGLRAQLVYMLQGFGAGLTQTLEGASRSLWFTMESRRRMLDDPEEKKLESEAESAKE